MRAARPQAADVPSRGTDRRAERDDRHEARLEMSHPNGGRWVKRRRERRGTEGMSGQSENSMGMTRVA